MYIYKYHLLFYAINAKKNYALVAANRRQRIEGSKTGKFRFANRFLVSYNRLL